MAIWELRCAAVNHFAVLVSRAGDQVEDQLFDTDGSAKDWKERPRVGYAVEPRQKRPKPRADVGLLLPGALVFNARAYEAQGPFLAPFGQLLELDCDGEPRWFFNVTRRLGCIDAQRSQRFDDGGLRLEAFDETRVPEAALVFKDPLTAPVRIYVNEAGKNALEALVRGAGLSGLECGVPQPL